MHKALAEVDPEIAKLVEHEEQRQRDKIRLIPSENYVSRAVLEASGSVLRTSTARATRASATTRASSSSISSSSSPSTRAKALFGVDHANVQPYSGSPANLAVYLAFCKPGDTSWAWACRRAAT